MINIIEKLLVKCNLGNLIEQPSRVYGGLINKMYKVSTATGIYAIKYLNPEIMKRPTAFNNHVFAEKIANISKENGISCLPAKVFNNSAIQEVDGCFFFIYDWFEGKTLLQEDLTIEICEIIAEQLAKIHNIDFSNLIKETTLHYSFNQIDWDLYLNKLENIDIQNLLKLNIEKFKILEKESIESLKKISNINVISHRDLDIKNVLWNNTIPMIIDWESAGLVNPVMELIDTAWNFSGGANSFDKDKFTAFVEAYKQNGGNTDNFDIALKANFKAKFGWLEYNLKRACKIECADEEEKILGENEVIRTIDEINKFNYYSKYMKG